MRVLFAGSPAIAVPSLEALAMMELEGEGAVLAGVLTNGDSRRGRHGPDLPTDVSAAASAFDAARKERGAGPIPQIKPEKLDARARDAVAACAPDLLVSFACRRLFGPRFLALFPLGGINIHPSLLPEFRGASPIPAAILARKKETGICIQKLAAGMDTGDILASERLELSGRETTASLSAVAGQRAAVMLRDLLSSGGFSRRLAEARPQEGKASYCYQIKKEAGLIDWNKSAAETDAQIRAYTPWPLSFTSRGKETLFILEARPLEPGDAPAGVLDGIQPAPGTVIGAVKNRGILIQTGCGILAATRLQWQAKKPLDWKSFCNGTRDFTGTRLGSR